MTIDTIEFFLVTASAAGKFFLKPMAQFNGAVIPCYIVLLHLKHSFQLRFH